MAPAATRNNTLVERTTVRAMPKACTTIAPAITCQELHGSSPKIPLAGPVGRSTTTPTLVVIRSAFAILADWTLAGPAVGPAVRVGPAVGLAVRVGPAVGLAVRVGPAIPVDPAI